MCVVECVYVYVWSVCVIGVFVSSMCVIVCVMVVVVECVFVSCV